ncbi:DUF262 domain-containing protein [Fenollaria massiliensis]|uniref:DUF262 domain-containing protein n=1 Tax=Fenollaria massiliensis TaxID=938288 RepID=A0A9E7DKG2_9FIRM|nr:DUF262 domain-containing protein [Fenollaria massiliensis]UQK59491.1 DUF262 domain-containing protein [Fenollaria massiliensis]
MSKLNIDQKTIKDLFSDKKSDFLIPDYQRPYAWEESECQTLWDDIFAFSFPDGNADNFDSENDEYFLGPIVTFKNQDTGKSEIIDGQQRITTLMLLLRAFYVKLLNMKDNNTIKTRDAIASCIWKADEFDNPDKTRLKIDSEVASDDDKEEFYYILINGEVKKDMKSRYANAFRFFEEKIQVFLNEFPSYFAFLPNRVLKNCILLPIEAESQDTALRIFSTLNDRGKSLSDTDIFKAQFYKYYASKSEKDDFIARWKDLETLSEKIFSSQSGSAMDELFTEYMYYLRAKQGIKLSTTEALRKFFEKNNYSLLKNDEALNDLEKLADFWSAIETQDEAFSERVLKQLFILNYAPNGMWRYFLSVYYMSRGVDIVNLDEEKLYNFLNKTIAFIWSYNFIRPGVNALRTPIYPEMVNLVNGEEIDFREYLFDKNELETNIKSFTYTNGRPITKSMLAWWLYQNPEQSLISLGEKLEVEHIFSRKRQEIENSLSHKNILEKLGNKALLEKNINIRAADYRLEDKKKYYEGYTNDKNVKKHGTKNKDLLNISKNYKKFDEDEILSRTNDIFREFIDFVRKQDLLK